MRSTSPALLALSVTAALILAARAAGAQGGLRKGPWLMAPRPDAIVVFAERDTAGPLGVRAWPLLPDEGATPRDAASPPAAVELTDAVVTTLHAMRLTGLVAGVRYRYEVRGPGVTPVGGSFTAPPQGYAPFRFVVYGDTRSSETRHVATVRGVQGEGAEILIHTGDLLSDGRSQNLWQQFFEVEGPALRDAPLVPVIGNHEIAGRGSPGVANFRRYMLHDEATDASGARVSVEGALSYSVGFGHVRFVIANAFDDWTAPDRQAWLEAELTRARREVPDGFVIVAMHWGLCSSGPHGENRGMRRAGVDALFRRHGVDLVLSGHDHFYERGDDDGLRYIVTGGGGAPLYRARHPRPYTLAFAAEHHYVRADVERDRITFAAIRSDGSEIDRCGLTHVGWDCPRGVIATVEPTPIRSPASAASPNATRSSAPSTAATPRTPGRWRARVIGVLLALLAALGLDALRRRRARARRAAPLPP